MPRIRDDGAIKRATQEAQERFPVEDDFQFMPGDPCAICGVELGPRDARDAYGAGAHFGCQKKFAQYTRHSVDDLAPAPQHVWAFLWDLFRAQCVSLDTSLERRIDRYAVGSAVQTYLSRRRELLAEHNPARRRAMELTDARRQRMIDFLTEAYSSGRTPTKEEVEATIDGRAFRGTDLDPSHAINNRALRGTDLDPSYHAGGREFDEEVDALVEGGMHPDRAAFVCADVARAVAQGHHPLCPLVPAEVEAGGVVIRPRISRVTGNYYEQVLNALGEVVSTRMPEGVGADMLSNMEAHVDGKFRCRIRVEGLLVPEAARVHKFEAVDTFSRDYKTAVAYAQRAVSGTLKGEDLKEWAAARRAAGRAAADAYVRDFNEAHEVARASGLQIETSQGRVGPGHSVIPTEQPAQKAEESNMTTENEKSPDSSNSNGAIPGTMSIFTQNVKRAGRNTALKTFNNQLAEAIIAVSKDKFPWVDTVEGRLAMTNAAPLILHQLCVRFPNMFPAASAARIAALAELASEHAMTDAMEQVLAHFMPMVQAFITVASAALEKMPEDVREELDAKAGKEKEKLPAAAAPSEEQQVVSKRKAAAANKTL